MPPRFLISAMAAGAWVVLAGMLMAVAFGYREMQNAFDLLGLSIPKGVTSLVLHVLVRLVIGAAVVAAMIVLARLHATNHAVLIAAGFVWLLVSVLPYAVIADWGVLPWSVVVKLWVWSAAELLIAARIGRMVLFGFGGAPNTT